jgi:hypothetical protein
MFLDNFVKNTEYFHSWLKSDGKFSYLANFVLQIGLWDLSMCQISTESMEGCSFPELIFCCCKIQKWFTEQGLKKDFWA